MEPEGSLPRLQVLATCPYPVRNFDASLPKLSGWYPVRQ